MLLLKLLWSFFQIGLFSFGGGYAALPLIQSQIVEFHGWLTLQEFTDVVTISQMTPGPIALNAASFVGTRVAGLPGAVVASFGCVLPSLIIVLILAWFYYRYRSLRFMQGILSGLRPAVVALIASAGLSILFLALFGSTTLPSSFSEVKIYSIGLFAIGFILMRRLKLNPILMIMGSGVLTVGLSFL